MGAFAELAVGGVVFGVVYVALTLLMRVPEVGDLLATGGTHGSPADAPGDGTRAVDGTDSGEPG